MLDFSTDNGPRCRACGVGTIYTYRATHQNKATVVVSANCVGCKARYPRAFDFCPHGRELTAALLSAEHRAAWATEPMPEHMPYWRAVAADDAWADELVRCYGAWKAGDARYDERGVATDRLRALHAAKLAADAALLP